MLLVLKERFHDRQHPVVIYTLLCAAFSPWPPNTHCSMVAVPSGHLESSLFYLLPSPFYLIFFIVKLCVFLEPSQTPRGPKEEEAGLSPQPVDSCVSSPPHALTCQRTFSISTRKSI